MLIQLEAKNPTEERLKAYLEQNASDVLAKKINTGRKTLSGFMTFASGEARKLLQNGSQSVCVEDEVVFGWLIHYFEEDALQEKKPAQSTKPAKAQKPKKKATEEAKKPVKAEKKKPQQKEDEQNNMLAGQMSLFDLLV